MGRALYRKYRSRSLDEIVGQQHITDILKRAIASDRIAHAYLLTGPKGVGKTSIARILAHEINQLPYEDESLHLDIIEIDAASNNSVDDIRDLRDKVQIAPVSAKRKIYIIDEVHMLSKQAFNALLKTLEEPPAHIVFILATTDVDKLPATIISRVQRYTFRAISQADAVKHLRTIADKESININDQALELIAQHGNGSFRDSISLLDQLANVVEPNATIERSHVEQALGLATDDAINQLIDACQQCSIGEITQLLDQLETTGMPASVVTRQLVDVLKNRVVEQPHLLPLLDALIADHRSSHPYMKLLTILAKPVANAAPQPTQTAPIKPTAPSKEPKPSNPGSKPTKSVKPELKSAKPATDEPTTNSVQATKPKQKSSTPPSEFNWGTLVEYVKEHSIAIASIISRSGHDIDDQKLTIYAGSSFAKNKLDDVRYRPKLMEAVQAAGAGEREVITLGTKTPPKDSQAAAIIAMMGGGEQVDVS